MFRRVTISASGLETDVAQHFRVEERSGKEKVIVFKEDEQES